MHTAPHPLRAAPPAHFAYGGYSGPHTLRAAPPTIQLGAYLPEYPTAAPQAQPATELRPYDWVWQQDLSPEHKFLLLALAKHANHISWECWPSLTLLAQLTGYNRKTVATYLHHLQTAGLVADTGRRAGRTRQVRVLRLVRNATGLPAAQAWAPEAPEQIAQEAPVLPAKAPENAPQSAQPERPQTGIDEQIKELEEGECASAQTATKTVFHQDPNSLEQQPAAQAQPTDAAPPAAAPAQPDAASAPPAGKPVAGGTTLAQAAAAARAARHPLATKAHAAPAPASFHALREKLKKQRALH